MTTQMRFRYLLSLVLAWSHVNWSEAFQALKVANPTLHSCPSVTSNTAPSPLATRGVVARRRHLEDVTTTRHSSRLYSLQTLVEAAIQPDRKQPRTIFVGGKGGGTSPQNDRPKLENRTSLFKMHVFMRVLTFSVFYHLFIVGKTTVSSSLAVQLAATNFDAKVLIVSTDPAHSLGDALDVDLRSGHGEPVVMTDPLTGGRLEACELDAGASLEDFRQNVAAFDIDRLADSLGVSPSLLESLGLSEFSGLLNNPPPGLDELVALSKVLDQDETSGYDVIIVDTAPTGHTLRLLQLPKFLDGLLGKLIKLRLKLSGLAATLQSFLGSEQAQQRKAAIDTAAERLERFREQMARLQSRLRNPDDTSFVVVTVPTKLGVAESQRLVQELGQQGVRVTDIVANQCVGGLDLGNTEALEKYYERRRQGQGKWLDRLTQAVEEVSQSEEYQSNGPPTTIHVNQVPFFDVELVGVPALAYVGAQVYQGNPNFEHLLQNDNSSEPKVVICGGKGGVGKTTTSSSLAVTMAAQGHKVALISTDPAHSLGDAIDMDLRGGQLIDCPLIGVPPTDGSLSVLEIDPTNALKQFKGIVDQLVGGQEMGSENAGMANTLRDLQEVFDTLPAGTDEVVALSKIVNLVKKGGFDRIVLDTAPTGE